MSNQPQEQASEQPNRRENILESVQRSFRKIWSSMSPEQQRKACYALFAGRGESREKTQRDILMEISSYRGWSNGAQLKEIIRNLSDADKAQACLEVVQSAQLGNQFYLEAIREWLIHNYIKPIGEYMDAVGIPNKDGIVDEVKMPLEKGKLVKLLLLHRDKPLEISSMYIGFMVADSINVTTARKKQINVWFHAPAALQEALGKPMVDNSVERPEDANKVKELEHPKSSLLLYERELLRALVDGAISRTSHLKGVEAEQMIRQLIDCSSSQPRHCFLLGFAQAIHGRPMEFLEAGGTEERNQWHVAGYLLGSKRVLSFESVYEVMGKGAAFDRLLAQVPMQRLDLLECGTVLAQTFAVAGDNARLIKLFTILKRVPLGLGNFSVIQSALNLASRLTTEQKYEASIELIQAAENLISGMQLTGSDKLFADYLTEKGQYQKALNLLGMKQFKDAQPIYAKIIATENSPHRDGARVWLSLAKAGINRIEDVFPQSSNGKYAEVMAKLEIVSKYVTEEGVSRHRLAQICSGLWLQSKGRHMEAIDAFDKALAEIPADSSYRQRNIKQWTSLCRAVSLVHELKDDCRHDIMFSFREAKDAGLKPASWYLLDMASPLGDFADHELIELMGRLLPEGDLPSFYKAQWASGAVKASPRLQVSYLAWLESSNEPRDTCWSQTVQLLQAGWRDGGQAPEDALDFLSFLAFQNETLAVKLIELLVKLGPSDGMLSQNELITMRARLHASRSDMQQAIGLLSSLFFNVANATDQYLQQMALAIYDDIKEMQGDVQPLDSLRNKLLQQFEPDEEIGMDIVKDAGEILVLYVGGNETQKRYEEDVRESIAAKYPNVKIEYFCPGWSSNWNKVVDLIRPKLPKADGMVLSYYVRTMFGRTIRKACPPNCPWWGAQGHGKASIIRGLERAIQQAALRRTRN